MFYLYNFRSLGSQISCCGSPFSPLSKPTGLINIWFCKKELCPISHDDLIIDWFSRANLYEMPHATITTFGPENSTQKTKVYYISMNIYKILIQCLERNLWGFPNITCLTWNSWAWKNLTSFYHISNNIAKEDLKFGHEVH